MSGSGGDVVVRRTMPDDFATIHEISRLIYASDPWHEVHLASHHRVFPEGQFCAADAGTGRVLGMCASLIVGWDDYDMRTSYRDFTDGGMFTNHDPAGRTLYGAEVMVHPDAQGRGVGSRLYAARRDLVRRLGLLRIRAGARLAGYGAVADRMTPEEYVVAVTCGELVDPTLTFQIRRGFRVLAVVRDYMRHDPESRGHAAVIEWLNPDLASPAP